MAQRETLVARAIVAYEVGRLRAGGASTPCPRLTATSIVDKYGLKWGLYCDFDYGADRARQNVRNELNALFRHGGLCKLRDNATGKKVRDGKNIVFVSAGESVERLRAEGFTKIWFDQ